MEYKENDSDTDVMEESSGSIGEDSELEASFALHELAVKIQSFQEKMKAKNGQDEIFEEIEEFTSESMVTKHSGDSKWNTVEKSGELHEMQDHIAKLIQGFKSKVNQMEQDESLGYEDDCKLENQNVGK